MFGSWRVNSSDVQPTTLRNSPTVRKACKNCRAKKVRYGLVGSVQAVISVPPLVSDLPVPLNRPREFRSSSLKNAVPPQTNVANGLLGEMHWRARRLPTVHDPRHRMHLCGRHQ